ncbi:hypothetical protein J1614_009062 [Plenodomus biglobosus]|nr:hypothetical protein J1614_009062 [Plenodomus biglobosus]
MPEGANCELKFQRTDARLKHHRKYHPDLASNPPKPREYARRRRYRSKEIRKQIKNQHGKAHLQKELKISPAPMGIEDDCATAHSDGAQSRGLGHDEDLLGIYHCVTP